MQHNTGRGAGRVVFERRSTQFSFATDALKEVNFI